MVFACITICSILHIYLNASPFPASQMVACLANRRIMMDGMRLKGVRQREEKWQSYHNHEAICHVANMKNDDDLHTSTLACLH